MISVDTDFLDICDKCKDMLPCVRHGDLYADDEIYMRQFVVSCENIEKCRKLKENIEKRLK